MKVRQVTFDEIMENPFDFIGKTLYGETKDKMRFYSIKVRKIDTYVNGNFYNKYIDTGYEKMQYYKDTMDGYNWYVEE